MATALAANKAGVFGPSGKPTGASASTTGGKPTKPTGGSQSQSLSGEMVGKPTAKPKPITPFGSGEAGTGNIPSILNKFVKTRGGWDKFGTGMIEKGMAKLGGGKARDAVTKAEDALYTELLNKRSSDDPNEALTSSEKSFMDKIESRKKGGKVRKKKKQGYKDRKDESIAMRVKKKRTKKQLKASRDESYGKWGRGKGKGKINKSRRKSTIRRTSGAGQGAKYIAGLYN